ncbi:uncharacterized protein LOC106673003 [Cimex lectularius]|uniref:CCHC-type domain-containing protein n=1 Tax=Cimex lectularius TaxID=79782 RepID=A0A8I6S9I6_CIMLE|nr:uncharacterized protein LOC106673003 [Cimex lectularius]
MVTKSKQQNENEEQISESLKMDNEPGMYIEHTQEYNDNPEYSEENKIKRQQARKEVLESQPSKKTSTPTSPTGNDRARPALLHRSSGTACPPKQMTRLTANPEIERTSTGNTPASRKPKESDASERRSGLKRTPRPRALKKLNDPTGSACKANKPSIRNVLSHYDCESCSDSSSAVDTAEGQPNTYAEITVRRSKRHGKVASDDKTKPPKNKFINACAEAHTMRAEVAQYMINPTSKCPKPAAMFVCERIDRIIGLLQQIAMENAQLTASINHAKTRPESQVEAIVAALTPAFDKIESELQAAKSSTQFSPVKTIVNELTHCVSKIKKLEEVPKLLPTKISSNENNEASEPNDNWLIAKPRQSRKPKPLATIERVDSSHPQRIQAKRKPNLQPSAKTSIKAKIAKAKEAQNNLIIIDPVSDMEPQALLQTVKDRLNPRNSMIRVEGLRITARGGVAIRVESDSAKTPVLRVFENTNLKAREMGKRNPRILVLRVPAELKANDVREEIMANNQLDVELNQIRPLHTLRYGRGQRGSNPFVSWVVELPPSARKTVLEKNKVYLDYQSCPARDYVDITRCYKCQMYGHVAATCPKLDPVCGKCAQPHDTRSCKEEAAKCANCHRLGIDYNHRAGSRSCEAHIRAVVKVKSTTDYGDTPEIPAVNSTKPIPHPEEVDPQPEQTCEDAATSDLISTILQNSHGSQKKD